MRAPSSPATGVRRRGWAYWRDLPLKIKGLVVILLPLLIVVADCGALALLQRQQAHDRTGRQNVYSVQRASAILLVLLLDAETGVRGYLVSHNAAFLAPYQQATSALPPAMDYLRAVHDSEGFRARLPQIENLAAHEMSVLGQLRAGATPTGQAALLNDGMATMDSLRALLVATDQDEQVFAATLDRRAHDSDRLTVMVAAASVPLAMVSGLLAMLLFTTGISRRAKLVEDNAERLGEGKPLARPLRGRDELARLDSALARAAELLHQRQSELTGATDRAQAADRAKSDFLSRMSHELRTPLNAIIGFGQLLELEAHTIEDRESVHQILRAARHLLELINEVLDLSRIEAGHLTLSLEPIHIDEMLDDALRLMAPIARTRGIDIRVTAPEEHDAFYVRADRQRLKQVLLNLLSNAIKYNHRDGFVVIQVTEYEAGRLRISVEDGGPGIPPDRLDRLFTPFDRLDTDENATEGTGLGLPLSKQLIDAMNGSIGVDTDRRAGSLFWIELPLTSPPPEPLDHDRPDADDTSQRSVVLYIEDNPANMLLMQRLLAGRPNTTLIPASHGRLGIDLAMYHRPDLIVLDLHLPDQDGHQILATLKQFDETRDIPVIVMTAETSEGKLERLRTEGATACLTKPLDLSEAMQAIDRALTTET